MLLLASFTKRAFSRGKLLHFLPFWYLNHVLRQALLDFSFAASTNNSRYS